MADAGVEITGRRPRRRCKKVVGRDMRMLWVELEQSRDVELGAELNGGEEQAKIHSRIFGRGPCRAVREVCRNRPQWLHFLGVYKAAR
jgi:hypothetical protein